MLLLIGSAFGLQQDSQSYRIDESRLLEIALAAMDDADGAIASTSTTPAAAATPGQKTVELQSASQPTGEELGYDRKVSKIHYLFLLVRSLTVLASGIAKGKLAALKAFSLVL